MTTYSGAHDPRLWVLPAVIEEQANQRGEQTFVSMVGGQSMSYRELRDGAAQVAGMLAGLGLAHGDRAALMLPSGLDFLRAWAGIGRLGATTVFLNAELSGAFLAHPIADSRPDILIIDAAYLERLDDIRAQLPLLKHIIVVGDCADLAARGMLAFEDWRHAPPTAAPLPAPSDLACIMYTSGTTGAPKGVLMPHCHCFLFGLGGVEHLGVASDDHYYVCLPLTHANGLLMQIGAVLIAGAQATVRARFSASSWLADIRASGATLTNTLGAISAFVLAQAPGERDREHKLRALLAAPNHPDHDRAWRQRFGIGDVVGGYGMTETNIALYGRRGEPRPGTCGRAYDKYFEVEIRDSDTDFPVPCGDVGEIMVRPRVAQGFMAGYFGQPSKTVEAWRNLWFHTGDAGRMDADGYITFIDRIKDCIRRRGENISATDIEISFLDLRGITEVAAFGVPSSIEGGEDEIMLAVVRQQGSNVTAEEIAAHARRKIPRFAQPRFVEFMSSLPKTASEKVRKAELKLAGVTASTIDLHAFGLGAA
jgi:crotonobetaine/carnitine-CoA ligase